MKQWKYIRDKYVWLSKRLNQSCSGVPGIDVLSYEENDFLQKLDFLRGHINRRKRYDRSTLKCLFHAYKKK